MNILWLHDNINDHTELDKQLKNFEKPIVNFTDNESCISFLRNFDQENNDRPSILVVLNRIARQIVPEIHSFTTLLFVIIFCTKKDNKIKWTNKYNKIKGIYISPRELITCVRQVIKMSGLVNPFSCQLVLLDDHPNEIMQQQFYRLDSSLIIFKQINSCLKHLRSVTYERPVILITVNALGRQMVPEIHSDNQLKAIFIYCTDSNEKIRWTTKYDKIKLVTTNIIDLINDVRNEGLYYSALPWHLVCLGDHSDKALQDRLYELDPCITTFDRFEICQKYLNSVNKISIATKPILFIAINRMGRQFIPEIHSNDRLNAFYIFVSSDSPSDRKIKWTTKYNKIKYVCTNLNQLIEYIKQDVTVLTDNIIQRPQTINNVLTPSTRLAKRLTIVNSIVCWLDANIDETNKAYQRSIAEIHQTVDPIRLFIDPNECIDFLTDIADEKVSLIISGSFGQYIIPLIHEISQLNTIYVFSDVSELNHEEWIKNYRKMRGAFTQIGSICAELKQDAYQSNQNAIPISFVSLSNSSNNVQLDQLDPLFMYSQLLKEILLDLEYDKTAIKEFVNYCRGQFVRNNIQLKIINAFETDYNDKPPVWWYTTESFIYSTLNRALRTFDIEVIVKMGFFIRDLYRHIEQLHAEQFREQKPRVFTVYRGQGLSETDFTQMIESRGGLLSFNNFLSTSLDRSVSLLFAERNNQFNPDLIGILFQLTVDPSISSAPFASVRDISRWQKEEEILFSMHTVFRIGNISQVSDRLFQVDLTLTGDNDQELQVLKEHIRRNIKGGTGFHQLGALMLEMGNYDKALEVYETLLSTAHLNKNPQEVSTMDNQLGAIYSQKGELDKALFHYQRSLDTKLTYLPPNDPSLSTVYSNIGSALRKQNQLDKAFEYMTQALNTELAHSHSDELKIASYRNNIGLVLTDQSKYDEALTHYEQALEIQKNNLPSNHPDLATSYNNIGAIFNELHNYDKALSYYEKSVEIMQRSLPANHPDLAIPYNNLGAIYNELQNYHSALTYYERSMKIMENSLPRNHPSLALAHHNLALTQYRLGSYSTALQHGEKAVEISHHALEPNDPQMMACQETLNAIRERL